MIAFLQHRSGELIDKRYLVQRVLGSGAFGTVYLCRDNELETEVAVKELHVLDDPASGTHERGAALEKFRAEAVNLSRLRHPHIVSGHYEPDNGTWLVCPVCGFTFKGTPRCPEHNAAPIIIKTRHYLVMEYLNGPDLDEAARAAGGVLPIPQTLRYLRQIADALKLIHARGLIHRDIKPENIRLRAASGSAGDDAVLLDFGIAGESGSEGDFGTRVQRHTTGGGTFGYAPESPAERRHPDARSDIHALGMTLFRLVSGRDPLEDADLSVLRRRRPRELNPAIPPALDDLIVRSISSEPNERPKDAAAWLAELENIISPRPAAAAPSHLPAPEFRFRSGEIARDMPSLLRLLDSHRAEAKDYLYGGELATWLIRAGRPDLAARAREVVNEYPDRRYQGLEAFAQSAGAPPPFLEVWPTTLDFGTLMPDGRRALTLKLWNKGRGHLFGFLRSGNAGLTFDEGFEGNRHAISVTLEARSLPSGEWRGEIVVDSSAGEQRVPCIAEIRARDRWSAAWTVWFWSLLGALGGWSLRVLPFWKHGLAGAWLEDGNFAEPLHSMAIFGGTLWWVLLILVSGEAIRRKSWGFFFSSGFAAMPVALVGGVFAWPILELGDAALRAWWDGAALHSTAPAAWSWLLVGCFLGALYGTLWRARDVFSSRIWMVLVGWLFVAGTFGGALLGIQP
ncbi:MAG TPA: serine/threonine-protein kinase [Abditibacteriaceae bacterium]|jgi:serine/threonine protein kinase